MSSLIFMLGYANSVLTAATRQVHEVHGQAMSNDDYNDDEN